MKRKFRLNARYVKVYVENVMIYVTHRKPPKLGLHLKGRAITLLVILKLR